LGGFSVDVLLKFVVEGGGGVFCFDLGIVGFIVKEWKGLKGDGW
jgi:hypothetical protein